MYGWHLPTGGLRRGLAVIRLPAGLLSTSPRPDSTCVFPASWPISGHHRLFRLGLFRLNLAGVELNHLFATSAILTAVLAISMQDTLGNLLGGLALQMDNSLEIGDWIKIDDRPARSPTSSGASPPADP